MANYAKNAASALRAITKAGLAAVLRRSTPGTYDTETATTGAPTVTNYPCVAVSFDYELQSSGTRQADGTLIEVGDRQIYIPAAGLSITPANGDLVLVDGETWVVKNVKKLKPASTAILYEIQGRH